MNVVADKSMDFAVRVVKLYKFLSTERSEFVMAKQVLRSGTSIGANIREANSAQSKPDFISKMCIALKECDETGYWLELLNRTDYLTHDQFDSLNADCRELFALLTSIIKSSKQSRDS